MIESSLPILNFLQRLYQLQSVNQLTETICTHLTALIGGENTIVCVHDGHSRSLFSVAAQHPFSCKHLLPDVNAGGIVATHPFWEDVLDQQRSIRTLSELVSLQDWHANPSYSEIYRYDQIEDQINTEIFGTMDCFTTVGVLRSKRGFSPADRETFTRLRPHLVQAFTNARMAEFGGLIQGRNEKAWVLPVDARGCVLPAGESAKPILALRFARAGRLPEAVESWVKAQAQLLSKGMLDTHIPPLYHRQGNQQWIFSLQNDLEKDSFLLCAYRQNPAGLSASVSKRENEILRWIDAGKSNEEIACILGLSVHTVKTHVKNLFRKLGVENRTAAARQWRQMLFEENGAGTHLLRATENRAAG